MEPEEFDAQAKEFAVELADLFVNVFDAAGVVEVDVLDNKATVRLDVQHLKVGGRDAARITAQMNCRPDSRGDFLKVEASKFALLAENVREPLVRLEYRDDAHSEPCAHWQVHAERGDLQALLYLAGKPHKQLSSVHLPVGGGRFRPCLEDFLEFVITECGVDAKLGAAGAIHAGREKWRIKQLSTAIRDLPALAAATLTKLGYTVTAPTDGHPASSGRTLKDW